MSAFELLLGVLFIFIVLVLTTTPKKPTPTKISTFGQYAVTATWPKNSNDDVDLWVEDPLGHYVWWNNQDAGLMHLESDDLGTMLSGTQRLADGKVIKVAFNGERTIIKGIVPGEYIVNIHMFRKVDKGSTPVVVQLWALRGGDRVLISKRIVLVRKGQEETAFRFTLSATGKASNFNDLQKRFVAQKEAQSGIQPGSPPLGLGTGTPPTTGYGYGSTPNTNASNGVTR